MSAELTYTIDPAHSTVRFWVRHMMISKVHGELTDVTGTVSGSPDAPELAKIDVLIKAASLTTGNEQRDGHLKSGDFLNVEEFPDVTYKSTSVKKLSDEEYEVLGDLTLHGVTKEVPLKVELSPEVPSPFGGYKVGVSATGKVDRDEFGITWNAALETGGVMVGKEIHLQIDLELDRPA